MPIIVDFGPCKAQALTIRTTSNGVIVMNDMMDVDRHLVPDMAVFNDPREFAAWCEAWMAANVRKP